MYIFKHQLRVRYAETDQMGFVYYGKYAEYFEVSRVEALRSAGFTYKELESKGVVMPVLDHYSKYIRPAKYDDLLTIMLYIKEMPDLKMKFEYEVYNEEGTLLNMSHTTLVFLNKNTLKVERAPIELTQLLKPYFAKA